MTTAPTRPGGGDAVERARREFVDRFDRDPVVVVSAPGRVNLIGEHTDYQDGFVLPMALRGRTAIALEPVDDVMCEVHAEGFGSETFASTDPPAGTVDWARYVHAVGALLPDRGVAVAPWRGTVATDVPIGASLSSSAALEVAAGRAFAAAAGLDSGDLDPLDLALTGRRVENEVFGLGSGIMDQLVSAIDRPGSAVLIDCRSLDWRTVPLPDGVAVLVLDTGTRRTLVDSAYGERRADCERAASLLGVATLRDASPDDWMRLDDERLRRRARHVIGENARVLDAVDALSTGDMVRVGALMDASHASLRDDFEVSSPALDAMVELVRSLPGCLGARMTGGGFAGCCVALVERSAAADIAGEVLDLFRCPEIQPAGSPTAVLTD
jgi:galactokinase